MTLAVLLTVLFVGLRLGDVIDWPWIWIFSPMWIGTVVWILVLLIFFPIGQFCRAFNRSRKHDKKRRKEWAMEVERVEREVFEKKGGKE